MPSAVEEQVVALALSFGCARDLARGQSVSRSVGQRCANIVAGATRIESVLLDSTDTVQMLEDCRSALTVQCRPGALLILYMDDPRGRGIHAKLRELVAGLFAKGVLPVGRAVDSLSVFAAQTQGLLGRTAAGKPVAAEGHPDILLAILPHAMARVEEYVDKSQVDDTLPNPTSVSQPIAYGAFPMTMAVLSSENNDDLGLLPPAVFGGRLHVSNVVRRQTSVSRGKVWRVVDIGGQGSPRFKLYQAEGFIVRFFRHQTCATARIRTFANGYSTPARPASIRQEHLRQQFLALSRDQHRDLLVGGNAEQRIPEPHAVFAFVCSRRGEQLYGEPSWEAQALHDVYGKSCAIIGMFCAAEIGPGVKCRSSDSVDEDSSNIECADAAASSWSCVQDFATVIAAFGR